MLSNIVYSGDDLAVLKSLPDACIDLIIQDPPYGSQKIQKHTSIKVENGDRIGFQG